MNDVKRDFQERVREIEVYFSFMENIMLRGAKMVYPDNTTEVFSNDLDKILKANSFLLLYNLSESCVKNAIEKIYTTISTERVNYDDLKSDLKVEIIKYLKNSINPRNFVDNINQLSYDIIMECFNADKLISGSLDAKKVKDLASRYGFSPSVLPIINPDGSRTPIDTENLLTVKKNRNDLSHGTFSFKECGKDYTIQDLVKIKNHVIAYLNQIIDNIETYILSRNYLSPSVP